MITNILLRIRSLNIQLLIIFLIATQVSAESGWKPEAPITAGRIGDRYAKIQFDNKNNTMIPTWDAGS
jgi:hypothetical protein